MSYDDDLMAIPSLCDSCFARVKAVEPKDKVLLFKCSECKYEFCLHLETAEGSRVCLDCLKATQHGPIDYT